MFEFILGLVFLCAPCAITAALCVIGVHPIVAAAIGVVLLVAIGKGLNG